MFEWDWRTGRDKVVQIVYPLVPMLVAGPNPGGQYGEDVFPEELSVWKKQAWFGYNQENDRKLLERSTEWAVVQLSG